MVWARGDTRRFWRPLLRAKFGPFYDQVAAVFIWATLTRLFGARSGAASKENLGYVRGGYGSILERFESKLLVAGRGRAQGLAGADRFDAASVRGCEVHYGRGVIRERAAFDQVFFTGPTRLARRVVIRRLCPSWSAPRASTPRRARTSAWPAWCWR